MDSGEAWFTRRLWHSLVESMELAVGMEYPTTIGWNRLLARGAQDAQDGTRPRPRAA